MRDGHEYLSKGHWCSVKLLVHPGHKGPCSGFLLSCTPGQPPCNPRLQPLCALSLFACIKMNLGGGQDWDTVVIRKKKPTTGQLKDESAVNAVCSVAACFYWPTRA